MIEMLRRSLESTQFTSIDWASFLKQHNLEHSMSRRGNCHDGLDWSCPSGRILQIQFEIE